MDLGKDRDKWKALINTVIDLGFHKVTCWGTSSFSRRNLLMSY